MENPAEGKKPFWGLVFLGIYFWGGFEKHSQEEGVCEVLGHSEFGCLVEWRLAGGMRCVSSDEISAKHGPLRNVISAQCFEH
jgi:hypothetical protein